MGTLNRRAFLQLAALGAAASGAACTSASVPASPPANPDAAQSVAPSPSPEAGYSAKRWDDMVAAARAEGRLSLLTLVGGGYGRVVESFQRAFPGIAVDRVAESSAGVWLRQARDGRRGGSSAFDLAFVQADRALVEGAPDGLWAPLRPLLVRPDVLDDAVWRDGLNARFLDIGGALCFAWEHQVIHAYAINTELAPAGEIKTVEDLLDPRWKGRILTLDPRLGTGLLSAASIVRHRGTDVVRRLLVDQQPVIRSWGPAQATEALVDGNYPIALGVRPKALNPLRAQGRGLHVQYLDLPDADFVAGTAMLYLDRAPHPAAATLFANWVLTREAQATLVGSLLTNSARTDVDAFEPDGTATPGATYYEPDREANYKHTAETQRFIHDLLRNT
jgi:iron(III) transport system substrate-binding protein